MRSVDKESMGFLLLGQMDRRKNADVDVDVAVYVIELFDLFFFFVAVPLAATFLSCCVYGVVLLVLDPALDEDLGSMINLILLDVRCVSRGRQGLAGLG